MGYLQSYCTVTPPCSGHRIQTYCTVTSNFQVPQNGFKNKRVFLFVLFLFLFCVKLRESCCVGLVLRINIIKHNRTKKKKEKENKFPWDDSQADGYVILKLFALCMFSTTLRRESRTGSLDKWKSPSQLDNFAELWSYFIHSFASLRLSPQTYYLWQRLAKGE